MNPIHNWQPVPDRNPKMTDISDRSMLALRKMCELRKFVITEKHNYQQWRSFGCPITYLNTIHSVISIIDTSNSA